MSTDLLSALPYASASVSLLTTYSLRVGPGVALFAALLAVLPKQSVPLRITVYMMLFFLLRDAMTPVGLWTISREGSLSLPSDPVVLLALGTCIGLFVLFLHRTEPALRSLVVWRKGNLGASVAAGLVGAVVVAAPAVALSHIVHPAVPPLPVAGAALPALLFVVLVGNVLEELIFRGWLQGFLEQQTTARRAAAASAIAFAAGHTFLATTVTDLGLPVLLFTLYEGTVAASLRLRWGIVPSSITHGGAIFLIASRLI